MCGRYELTTQYKDLPSILKEDLPLNFKEKYAQQELIRPTDPVLVLKNEGKIATSLMLWGFISEWAKDPFDPARARPFNARAETVVEKKLFRGSWRHKRCVLPANGFFEKGHRIRKKNSQPFWIAGIWNRWMNSEGSELDSCCILTTDANKLVRAFHNRMPVIIPNGSEESWITPVKNGTELKVLEKMLSGWSPEEWVAEAIIKPNSFQGNLFGNYLT